jgi:putative AdoMet-dependent methyltransferase
MKIKSETTVPISFSQREKAVIELLLQGKSNKQIAAALGVSIRTIEYHLSNIYAKLETTSRTETVLKLSATNLRESTGSLPPPGLRDSTVEKTGDSSDNDKNSPLRRRIMRILLRVTSIVIAGLLFTTLIFGLAGALRSRGHKGDSSGPLYHVLGPAMIEKDGILLEVSGLLTCAELTVNLHGIFPQGFSDQFPNGEIPPIFNDMTVTATADGIPLELEAFGGGGGGGEDDHYEFRGQGRAYHLLTPIATGQQVHVAVVVTLNDYIGIPEPVPFELSLIVADCVTPTPAPYLPLENGTIVSPNGVTITEHVKSPPAMTDLFPASEFDDWAETYDRSVSDGRAFPFAGYTDLLQAIVRLAAPRPGLSVLDLGTGTGNLAILFAQRGCDLWCTDFSAAMLAKARQKLPSARFALHDLRTPLPPELDRPFDLIVSAYVFHHFELTEKIRILMSLAARPLSPAGRIVIGDVAFPNAAGRERVREEAGEEWDEEFYWLADEAVPALENAGFKVEYIQVSPCAGVFSLQRAS